MIKHPHAIEKSDSENPYVELVKYVFHLARKRYGWSKRETEQRYRALHDNFLKDLPKYPSLSVDEQRLILFIATVRSVYFDTPEKLGLNKLVI